ncbi:MAG: hypothetical protein KGQ60_18265 [Planctomycetes bacterium]|nr:hypothetical protein [Planctomycetota bacterium]
MAKALRARDWNESARMPGARALWLMILEVPLALPDTFLTAARLTSPLYRLTRTRLTAP